MQFSIKKLLLAQAIIGTIVVMAPDKSLWAALNEHREIVWAWAFLMGPLFVVYVLSPLALRVVIGTEFIVNAVHVRFLDKKTRK